MDCHRLLRFSQLFIAVCSIAIAAQAQVQPAAEHVKPRIAVFPFDDRTSANKDMNIGTKVADLLIAKLTSNSAFTVYDRQYVDRLLAEKNLKYDPNYDSAGAAKAGLMGTVDMVISGQIDAFNANTNESTKSQLVRKVHQVDGSVALKVTARLISVEKGSIVVAPTAGNEQKGVLAQDNTYMKVAVGPKNGLGYDNATATKNQDQALRKLVDQAAEEVAANLSTQLVPSAEHIPAVIVQPKAPVSLKSSDLTAKFVGLVDGVAYMDKGASAGVKTGDTFFVRRSTKTALKDGAGKPIMSHKPICTLVVSSVEEASASGKCTTDSSVKGAEAAPRAGDEVISSAK
jgi:curli biogenesis system outer membrane secretion channel CsgG